MIERPAREATNGVERHPGDPTAADATTGGARGARRLVLWLLGGVGLMVAATFAAFVIAGDWTPEPPPPLVFSKETTWLTGPLTANGRIDWAAAVEAEAIAAGWREEQDGGRALEEAEKSFVSAWEFLGRASPAADGETRSRYVKSGVESICAGNLDSEDAQRLLPWLDSCAPSFERAKAASTAAFLRLRIDRKPYAYGAPILYGRGTREWVEALVLNGAVQAAHQDVDAGLESAAIAWRLAHLAPTSAADYFWPSQLTLQSDLLELLRDCTKTRGGLPLDSVMALLDATPDKWVGENPLRETLRCTRLYATELLDFICHARDAKVSGGSADDERLILACGAVDPNPLFQRLQREFDALERDLFAPSQPFASRLAAFRARLDDWERRGAPLPPHRTGRLGMLMYSQERMADLWLDRKLGSMSQLARMLVDEWLAATARREALLAEFAARAGAPERRDSLLGQPLKVTRRADGSFEVQGELLDLAPPFDAGER